MAALADPATAMERWDELEADLAAGGELSDDHLPRYGYAVAVLAPRIEDRTLRIERATTALERLRRDPEDVYSPYLYVELIEALGLEERHEEALQACREALLYLRGGHPDQDGVRRDFSVRLADLLRYTGGVEEAEEILGRLLREELPDAVRARALGVRAQSLVASGSLDLAARDIAGAVAAARAAFASGTVDAQGLAETLWRSLSFQIPLGFYGDALDLAAEIQDLEEIDETLRCMALTGEALALLERRRREQAASDAPVEWPAARVREALEFTLDRAEKGAPIRQQALLALADLELFIGNAAAAERHVSAMRADPTWQRSTAGRDHRDLAIAATLDLKLAGLARDAERYRKALADAEHAYSSLLAAWADQPLRPAGVGFLHFRYRRDLILEMIRAQLELHGASAGASLALDQVLRGQALDSLSRRGGAPALTARELSEEVLAEGEGVVVFMASVERAYAFAVDADGVQVAPLEAGQRLLELAVDLSALVRRPPSGNDGGQRERDIEELAAELGKALFPAPIASRVAGWSHVAISGAELVGDPVMAVLPVEGIGVLGRERALSSWPSVAAVAWLRRGDRTPSGGPGHVVVLGEPSMSSAQRTAWPRLDPLPPAGVGSASKRFAGSGIEWLGDAAVTKQALHHAGERAAVTVLFAHGVHDPMRERPGGLLLAPTADDPLGALHSDELERLALSPLVVFASCGAARGPVRLGDHGTSHLAGAATFAGARTAILAASDVSYRASIELAVQILRALSGNASAGEALRAARDRLAATDAFRDPFYWANFELYGDGSYKPALCVRMDMDSSRKMFGRAAWLAVGGLVGLLGTWALAAVMRRPDRVSKKSGSTKPITEPQDPHAGPFG